MAVRLAYAPRRVSCPPCGAHVQATPWVSATHRQTRAMAVVLVTWARILTWKQVAALFHVAWGTVADAVEEAVAYGLAHQALSEVTHTSPGCSDAIRVTSWTTSHRPPITLPSNEGLNNKARIISHKAYGFRTPARCIRNLYHCMADLPLSKTVHTFV